MNDIKIIELYFSRSEDAITETDKKYGGYRSVGYDEIAGCLPSSESVETAVDRKAVLKGTSKKEGITI